MTNSSVKSIGRKQSAIEQKIAPMLCMIFMVFVVTFLPGAIVKVVS